MLKGEKVVLRPMNQDDVDRQHEFNQDIELYGLDSDYPRVSPFESAKSFYDSRTQFNDDIAPFAIEVERKYIGFCTLMHLRNRYGNLELGIMIADRAYWGKGYGREVITLLLKYGFHYLGARRIALTTNAKNVRAIRCFSACGFQEEGRPRKVLWIEGEYIDLVNMSILREEWEARANKGVL
jgi:RimJ/RimL family protein N-acetyltransferase